LETPIGILPAAGELHLDGLAIDPATLDELLAVDRAGWQAELASIGEYLDSFAPRLPAALRAEQQRVADALESAARETAAA
jgi:phosphoenolpyruvate carboxykinase (GTP)